MANEEVTCSKCGYVAASVAGLKAHTFRKHTQRGRRLAKEAAIRMNSPSARKKSLATKAAKLKPEPKPKPKRKYQRLQRAANIPLNEVKFCPRCGCNLEAVSVALAFAAANR